MKQREFNTHNALTNAMEVFWLKGYKGASLDDLCTAMEIGKISFYATFDGKYELFIKLLNKIAIKLLLAGVVDRAINTKRGCMFGKTAFVFWQSDENILNVVSNGANKIKKHFLNSLNVGEKIVRFRQNEMRMS